MKKTHLSIHTVAYVGVMAALYFALSFLSIKLGNMKLSVAGLPIVVSGLLLGPLAGFLTGLAGAFLEQLVTYGITATTILWVLPAALRGLIVGLYAKHRGFELDAKRIFLVTLLSGLVLTALNTLSMYLDSKILGYYSFAYVFGAMLPRIAASIVTSILFSLILPPLVKLLRRHVRL